eukprot:gene1691-biopygen1548
MDDNDTKPELPKHIIIGASDYARIKTAEKPRIEKKGEPVAELTALGTTIMSPGKEADLSSIYLTRRSSTNHENLCRQGALGLEDKQSVYQFTRALFGLLQSPFLLGGTIEGHLDTWKEAHQTEVEEIQRSPYVDDVATGMNAMEETKKLKEIMIKTFGDAKITLHKWHSNVFEHETNNVSDGQHQTFVKEQLGGKGERTNLLGLKWNKSQDTLPEIEAEKSKWGIL